MRSTPALSVGDGQSATRRTMFNKSIGDTSSEETRRLLKPGGKISIHKEVVVQARCLTSLCLLLTLLTLPFVSAATQQPLLETKFCFGGNCYPTLSQAEADLRATSGPYGSLWQLEKISHYMDAVPGGVVLMHRYVVKDQEALLTHKPGYRVGGNGAREGICSAQADPRDPTMCASLEEGVEGMMAVYRSQTAPFNCVYSNERYEGSFGEPYVSVRDSGGYGTIDYVKPTLPESKFYKYSVWCPGWGAPDASPRELQLTKAQHFECAVGFKPIHADNPAYHPLGTGLEWPRVCKATMPAQYIYQWNVTQTRSCPSTKNPCFPATGDKARAEPDFEFAGRPFVRHYHSLNQLQAAPELGTGWSHSYADFLMSSSNRIRADDQGYLQLYGFNGRGAQAYGEVLRAGPGETSVLTDAEGVVRRYNPNGRLVGVDTGSPQSSVTVIYDRKSRIDRITDGVGRSLLFGYENDRLASITLPDGSKAIYGYDEFGNQTSVIRPDGTARTYLYGEAGHAPANVHNLMTGIVEGNVRFATFSYNAKGKVVSSHLLADDQPVDAGTITYNPDGSATTTSELGEVKQLEIGGGQFRAIIKTTDARGARSQQIDSLGRTSFKVDALGNRTTMAYTDYAAGVVSQVVLRNEEAIGRISSTIRDANNRVVENRVSKQTAAGEQLTSLSRQAYDPQGRLRFACQYDVSESTDYVCGSLALAPPNVRQTQNTYCSDADAAGNPSQCPLPGLQLSTINPIGASTHFEYYAANDAGCDAGGSCQYRKGDLKSEVDPLGRRTEYLEYDALGNPVQIKGIDGTVVERLFDTSGRVLAETLKGDVPANDRITLNEYNSTGKLTRTTGPDGVWTRMHYDTADRLTSVEDATGNRINYVLDGAGNRLREEVRDSAGVLRRSLDRLFDTASRMTRVTGADGHATQMRYDAVGNLLETENPAGTVSKTIYDGVGRPLQQIDDLGGINAEVRYEYAGNGQVEREVDPKGLATTYAYDGFGQLVTQVSPDTGTTTFTYDSAGNVLTRTDARGVTANYSYDALGRTTAVTFVDPEADIHYVYDQPSSQCAEGERAGVGRLASMIDPSGRTDYCYNLMGDLVRRVQVTDGQALTLHYTYDASCRLQTMTYPDGSLVDYGYDALGQITSMGVTPAGGSREVLLQGLKTLPFGPVTTWTFGNGRRLDRSYDQDYRPVAISDARDGLNVAFGFDPVGNMTSLTDVGQQGQGATLNYDALGRLTAFKDAQTGVAIEQYSYDATGNRLSFANSAGLQAYTYAADSHRLTSVDGTPRTYDAMGNTLSIGGEWQYTYDLAGRLSGAAKSGAAKSTYRYSASGERVTQHSGTDTRVQLHGEGGEWLGSYGANSIPAQQVVWLGSTAVGLIEAGKVLYVESDHMGSPRALLDPQRDEAVWRWGLMGEAFGNGSPDEDPDQDGLGQEFSLRFPGQRSDSTTGLSYNYYRDYEPETGRYSQSDPIGLYGGLSTFGYALGNPLLYSDPLGLVSVGACANPANIIPCQAAGIGLRDGAGKGLARSAAAAGGAAAAAAGLNSALNSGKSDDCGDDDDDCGPDTRFQAYIKALAWAGLSIGDEGDPVPWKMYNGRGGKNYAYVRQNGGNNYGYSAPEH